MRLNLKKPAHQHAWDVLQNTSSSYTETIVNAINASKENSIAPDIIQALRPVIYDAVTDALSRFSPVPAGTVADSSPDYGQISDDDFDIADEFMSCL